jgi:hypothetical protein
MIFTKINMCSDLVGATEIEPVTPRLRASYLCDPDVANHGSGCEYATGTVAGCGWLWPDVPVAE